MERDKVVVGETYPSMEYDRSSKEVVGLLEVRHVPTFGYDQYLVDGEAVDPNTVHPLVENTFCPTGDGGGVDPSCSPKKEHGHGKPDLPPIQPHKSIKEATKDNPHDNEWGPRAKGKVAYGAVIFDSNGLVLLRRPTNHYDGYEWTFAKGGQDEGEHPAETASREVLEETGRRLRITGVVPGGHEVSSSYLGHDGELHHGYHSTTYYYLGRSVGNHPEHMDSETFDTRWASPEKAKELISRTTNKAGRARDLKVLEEATKANAKLTGNANPEGCNQYTGPGCAVVPYKGAGTKLTPVPDFDELGHYPLYHVTDALNVPAILKLGLGTVKDYSPIEGVKSLQEDGWVSWTRDPAYAIKGGEVRLVVKDKQSLVKSGHNPQSQVAAVSTDATGDNLIPAYYEAEEATKGIVPPHMVDEIQVSPKVVRGWYESLKAYRKYAAEDAERKKELPLIAAKLATLEPGSDDWKKWTRKQRMIDRPNSYQKLADDLERMINHPKIKATEFLKRTYSAGGKPTGMITSNKNPYGVDILLRERLGGGNFVDDVLQVFNAFCPTGAGGGVDPSCSPSDNPTGRKEFKEWFEGSKVTNEDGSPTVVYHSTPNEFSEFKGVSQLGHHFGEKEAATDRAKERQGTRIIAAYLHIKNPLRLDDYSWDSPDNLVKNLGPKGINIEGLEKINSQHEKLLEEFRASTNQDRRLSLTKEVTELRKRAYEEAQKSIKQAGYDGVQYHNETEGDYSKWSWIAFDSAQIKSTTAKLFSKESGDIYNAFCPTGPGGGVDPSCSPHPELESTLVLPPDPNFISSKVDLVKANKEKVEQLKTLAKAGDVASLKAEPPHPSPKVQQYKEALIKAIQDHEEKKAIEAVGHKQGDLPGPNSELHVIKGLPGSTSPDLVEDTYGNKFVRKMPKDENNLKADQLRNEIYTDAAYRAAGILTPKSHIVEGVKGPIKYSEFIPGAQTLAEWEQGKSIGEVKAMHKEIGKNFVADALLANYDVLGTAPVGSNILVKDGKPYRVDNGGGLKYRAQGKPKDPGKFGSQVRDLQTMRDQNINPGGAKVFGHITDADIHTQIKGLLPKKEAILEAIKDPQTKAIVAQRLDYLEGLLPKPPPLITPASKSATSSVAPKAALSSSPASPLHTAQGMVAHIAKNAYMAKFTKMDLEKLALLNPNGIKDGVIKIPRVTALTKKRQAEEAAKPSGRYLDSERVKELGKMFPDTTVTVLKGKYLSKNKVVGLTKSYVGEGTFTTTGTEEGQAVTDRLAGVPSHLHQYLPEIKSNSSVKLSVVPLMYDKQEHLKWTQGLTSAEHSAFSNWKGSPRSIKAAIAKGDTTSSYGKQGVAIESGIAKAAPVQGVFYRGIHGSYALDQVKQIKEAGIGGTWSDNSPHGMSPNPHTGTSFSGGDVTLRIVAKSCRSIHKEDGFGANGPSSESEHLGMSNTKYRIAGIYDNVHCTDSEGHTNKKVKHIVDLVEL